MFTALLVTALFAQLPAQPTLHERTASVDRVNAVFGKRIEGADSSEDHKRLAADMLAAAETERDDKTRFVLLDSAKTQFVLAGDMAAALGAVRRIAVGFAPADAGVEPSGYIAKGNELWDKATDPMAKLAAAEWYVRAEGDASGLDKTMIEGRLREATEGIASGQSGSIDLLTMIDTRRDTVTGKWRIEHGRLISPPTKVAKLAIPFSPGENYDLAIEGMRPGKIGALLVGLIIGGRQALLVLDGLEDTSGLELINEKTVRENPTRNKTRNILGANKKFVVTIAVRGGSIKANVNGRAAVAWGGSPSSLRVGDPWTVPNKTQLFIGSDSTAFRINKIELSPMK